MRRARATGTNKRYAPMWNEFVELCVWTGCEALPGEKEHSNQFSVVGDTGRAGSVDQAAASVRARRMVEGRQFVQFTLVKQTIDGIKRIAAEEKEPNEKRDPVPVRALVKWVAQKP